METKKHYTKPTVKCVEFKAELGFALSSLSQGTDSNLGVYSEENVKEKGGNRFGGYFTNNNDDWD